MQCASCGTDVPAESLFCPKCGERLGAGEAPGDPAPAPTPKEKFQEAAASRTGGLEDEEDLWHGGYSGKAMIGSWLMGGFATIGLIVLGVLMPPAWIFIAIGVGLMWLVLVSVLAYRKLSVDYQLTNQRFIHKAGILKRVTDRIEVIDIDDVTFEQGIVERMVNVGTVRISSSDRSHPELLLRGIEDVMNVADNIDNVRRTERRRRGLHIEAI